MKLITMDGTAKEVVVVTQEHLAALISIAKAAFKLSEEVEKELYLNGIEIDTDDALVALQLALKNYAEV